MTILSLVGLRVVELAGLAPAPFAGMMLGDFGANVIRVDEYYEKQEEYNNIDVLARNKRSISINLKNPIGIEIFKKLIRNSDVLIEPFRPGIMEKLGLGPDELFEINGKLIYARLTGFGQEGKYSKMAGHDINYLAISGVLSLLGRKGENPMFPLNLLALIERSITGIGKIIVDSSMVDGVKYLATFSYLMKKGSSSLFNNMRGENLLDGGAHFYEVYQTKDNKYIATQDEWTEIFHNTDSCVTPVLELTDSPLSLKSTLNLISTGKHTLEILHEIGYDDDKIIKEFQNKKIINRVILDNSNSNHYIIKSYL
ncbi:1935_t:CDS:2 [Entrophospora sp. SA101]|nr:1935_t:CDS:2 [Entrophospora sp. SA101]